MDAQADTQVQFNVDGRLIVARPRPEDEATLARLASADSTVNVGQTETDTEGHWLSATEVMVDVEGHAMTLRLPNAGDAQAIRRALAISAIAATIAVGMAAATAPSITDTHAAPIAAPAPAAAPAHARPVVVGDDVYLGGAATPISGERSTQPTHITAAPVQQQPTTEQAPQFNRDGSRHE